MDHRSCSALQPHFFCFVQGDHDQSDDDDDDDDDHNDDDGGDDEQ